MMTECRDCARAEMTRCQRIIDDMVTLALGLRRPSPFEVFAQGYASTLRIMMGAAEPTWYDKHRERWVETGDATELVRMSRHVA
jgi:hypothetical protein